MSSIKKNIAGKKVTAGRGLAIGIVRSQYNSQIVEALHTNCVKTLLQSGVAENKIKSITVPGAFELPFACQKMAKTNQYDVIIALGVVIRGQTPHFDFIASSCAQGIMNASLETGIPIIFGVLTTNSVTQAKARIEKGIEAALAAIAMTNLNV